MGIEYLILILIGFMLVSALIAVEARDLLSCVICVGAAGFALSVIDLLLGAPDLAITQVVVEIVALVLLIRMIVRRDDTSVQTPRDTLRTGLVLLAGGVMLAAAFFAMGHVVKGSMPPFGQPLLAAPAGAAVGPGVAADYLQRSAGETGAGNVVMAILLDYRGYDTLGEATVIFASIVGAYAILRSVARGRRKEEMPT